MQLRRYTNDDPIWFPRLASGLVDGNELCPLPSWPPRRLALGGIRAAFFGVFWSEYLSIEGSLVLLHKALNFFPSQ